MSGRIHAAFAAAKAQDRAAFVPYLTAGYPDRAGFLEAVRTLTPYADLIEVGLPYSDPLGDGPTIQRSSEAALAGGVRTADVLDMIRELRAETDVPLLVMTYYNPIFCYAGGGEAGFVRDVAAAGGEVPAPLPDGLPNVMLPRARTGPVGEDEWPAKG